MNFNLNEQFDTENPNEDEFEADSTSSLEEKDMTRSQTAPPRPLTEIEEFRKSRTFGILEKAVFTSSHLIQKNNHKYDLDSAEGQKTCRKFLKCLEKLHDCFKTKTNSRNYRQHFTNAYKILYKDGSLCYLTEILDSAQEAYPFLWVNGRKYDFTNDVLDSSERLFSSFTEIQQTSRNVYINVCNDSSNQCLPYIRKEMAKSLEEFDNSWTIFEREQQYVSELMYIEADARRYISDAIETEKELMIIETREKMKGKVVSDHPEIPKLKQRLCAQIGEINSVANSEGKGRADLKYEILAASGDILKRISMNQSRSVRMLAEDIRKSFQGIRDLLKKYEQNIEVVDPQLKNNPDLVAALVEYEKHWERGKTYFLSKTRFNQLLHFSQLMEGLVEKYSEFKEILECRDADVFVLIPCILIFKALQAEDKGICLFYLPDLYEEGKKNFNIFNDTLKGLAQVNSSETSELDFEFYNLIEKLILQIKLTTREEELYHEKKTVFDSIIHKIKILSIELQRFKPSEWNEFMVVALRSSEE